jgi:hypothetical protein
MYYLFDEEIEIDIRSKTEYPNPSGINAINLVKAIRKNVKIPQNPN